MEKDCKVIWSNCLKLIEEQLPQRTFKTWFVPIRPLRYKEGVLTIQVASNYVYEYLEGQFIDILRNALTSVIGENAKLEYSVVVENRPRRPESFTVPSLSEKKPGSNTIFFDQATKAGLKNPFEQKATCLQIDTQLNPVYTMDSFIEGSCNRMAKSVGMAIAERPGETAFNPLLIYGGSGLGKTHLAQAIGLEVKRRFPDKVVLYVSTNLFQTQFTEAVRKNEINDFMHFYQLIDVLILDDIQDLANKTATQNTFFHIFNHLQQLRKQLILTSDKAPAELSDIEDRLLSRFKWGLSAEIKAPDYETRRQIVQYKAKKDGISFSDEIIDYICRFVKSNVRELEGAIVSLLAQSTFNHKDLTVDLVRDILEKMVRRQEAEDVTISKIQKVVCDYYHLDNETFQARTRKREIVQARQLAMYFCKNCTKESLSTIGSQIGKKDHTTVLYACKAVNDLMETDREFRMEVEEIQRKIYGGCV